MLCLQEHKPEHGLHTGERTSCLNAGDQADSVVQAPKDGSNTDASAGWHAHLLPTCCGNVVLEAGSLTVSQCCQLPKHAIGTRTKRTQLTGWLINIMQT